MAGAFAGCTRGDHDIMEHFSCRGALPPRSGAMLVSQEICDSAVKGALCVVQNGVGERGKAGALATTDVPSRRRHG